MKGSWASQAQLSVGSVEHKLMSTEGWFLFKLLSVNVETGVCGQLGNEGGGLKSKHQSHDTQLSLAHHWIDFFSLITQIYIVHIRETVWGSVFVVSIHFILKRQFTPKSFFSLWLLFIHLYCFGVSCGTIMELDGTRLVVVKLAKNKCETVRGLYFFLFSGWTAQGPHCLAILALQGEMWNKGVMYGKQGHRFY